MTGVPINPNFLLRPRFLGMQSESLNPNKSIR